MFAGGEQENRPVGFGLDHSPQKTAHGEADCVGALGWR